MISEWKPTGKQIEAPAPTPAQVAKRKAHATSLCKNAANLTSWLLADRMAERFECEGCIELGIGPPEDKTDARQKSSSNRNKQRH